MIDIKSVLVLLSLISVMECKMEPYVVNGKGAKIKNFPHSVFINVNCGNADGENVPWSCGGSIVNEKITLTAAHCLDECTSQSQMFVSVGHSHRDQGAQTTVLSFFLHSRYKPAAAGYDIGLVRLTTPLQFSTTVQRLAIMKNPPYYEKAQIAGWGFINDVEQIPAEELYYTDQSVMGKTKCLRAVPGLPEGAICATNKQSESYPSRADVYNGEVIPWICGSSVLNEKILLTAAHCLEDCSGQGFISANFGHKHKDKGSMSTIVKFVVHEKYDKFTTANDIALVRPKTPLMLNRNTKRVAIMKNPPYYEKAQIAGWGVINDIKDKHTSVLHFVDQYVWHSRKCVKTIKSLALGGLCASSRHADSYSSRGDSGSALVVRGYIQIGIVSYKLPKVSRSLVVYTDTGFFYDWIKKNSRRLYCV